MNKPKSADFWSAAVTQRVHKRAGRTRCPQLSPAHLPASPPSSSQIMLLSISPRSAKTPLSSPDALLESTRNILCAANKGSLSLNSFFQLWILAGKHIARLATADCIQENNLSRGPRARLMLSFITWTPLQHLSKGEQLSRSFRIKIALHTLFPGTYVCIHPKCSVHIKHSGSLLRFCLCLMLVRKSEIELDENEAAHKFKIQLKSKQGQSV